MIKRFIKVTNGLYRGGAPTVQDIKDLYDKFGVRKIVSLDAIVGHKIDRICKLLGIEHIIIPIDMIHLEPIAKLLSYNLYDLLIEDGPTFVHCIEGKDRTGMVVAMFKCQYMDWSCNKAIDEAESLGFGIGLDPRVVRFYEKLICMSCADKHNHANLRHIDENSADITGNSRDEALTYIDDASVKSFAPYLDPERQFTYPYDYNQFPTRDNIEPSKTPLEDKSMSDGTSVPQVGIYDNDAGVRGIGPVENGGGFVNF